MIKWFISLFRKCPICGSFKVVKDGDFAEELMRPDRGPGPLYLLEWYSCKVCTHHWKVK